MVHDNAGREDYNGVTADCNSVVLPTAANVYQKYYVALRGKIGADAPLKCGHKNQNRPHDELIILKNKINCYPKMINSKSYRQFRTVTLFLHQAIPQAD